MTLTNAHVHRLAATKSSTPTLKARWYDDEGIAAVDPAAEDTANTLKSRRTDTPVETLSVQDFFDRLGTTPDEPASG